jgi:hypothetical protein
MSIQAVGPVLGHSQNEFLQQQQQELQQSLRRLQNALAAGSAKAAQKAVALVSEHLESLLPPPDEPLHPSESILRNLEALQVALDAGDMATAALALVELQYEAEGNAGPQASASIEAGGVMPVEEFQDGGEAREEGRKGGLVDVRA